MNESEFGTGWDSEDDGGASKWLKLKAGDEVMINIFGPARKFEKHWEGQAKPSQRWDVQVYNVDAGCLQTFEFGWKVFSQIKALAERYNKKGGSIASAVVCVSRTGSGKNDTSYLVAPDHLLDEAAVKERAALLSNGETGAESDPPF